MKAPKLIPFIACLLAACTNTIIVEAPTNQTTTPAEVSSSILIATPTQGPNGSPLAVSPPTASPNDVPTPAIITPSDTLPPIQSSVPTSMPSSSAITTTNPSPPTPSPSSFSLLPGEISDQACRELDSNPLNNFAMPSPDPLEQYNGATSGVSSSMTSYALSKANRQNLMENGRDYFYAVINWNKVGRLKWSVSSTYCESKFDSDSNRSYVRRSISIKEFNLTRREIGGDSNEVLIIGQFAGVLETRNQSLAITILPEDGATASLTIKSDKGSGLVPPVPITLDYNPFL